MTPTNEQRQAFLAHIQQLPLANEQGPDTVMQSFKKLRQAVNDKDEVASEQYSKQLGQSIGTAIAKNLFSAVLYLALYVPVVAFLVLQTFPTDNQAMLSTFNWTLKTGAFIGIAFSLIWTLRAFFMHASFMQNKDQVILSILGQKNRNPQWGTGENMGKGFFSKLFQLRSLTVLALAGVLAVSGYHGFAGLLAFLNVVGVFLAARVEGAMVSWVGEELMKFQKQTN